MRRRLLNLTAALSLLLCVAVLALWARSYWRSDQVIAGRTVQEEGKTWPPAMPSSTPAAAG